MTDVIVERRFHPPLTEHDVLAMGELGAECLKMHRVTWNGSLLAGDGHRLVCHFEAADAESVRTAFRQVNMPFEALWPGTRHDAFEPLRANVVVERRFGEPVQLEDVQAVEDAHAWCLEAHGVKFARTLFSRDRCRMICLYRAPDAESVRLAQREAGMPLECVWPCSQVRPPPA